MDHVTQNWRVEKPVAVTYAIHLLFCTKNLERVGDHATNIAEAVYYMSTGETLSRERPKADVTSALAAPRVQLSSPERAMDALMPMDRVLGAT